MIQRHHKYCNFLSLTGRRGKTRFSATSFLFLLLCFLLSPSCSAAQYIPVNPKLMNGSWEARWITCPGVPVRAYGVYHFRKEIILPARPDHFIINVSADNRYKLFVNGVPVGKGPARSSLYDWNFETYDIESYLHAGNNLIAALVWNMGEYAPVAQISSQTGFLLQGDSPGAASVNTGTGWKVLHDTAYDPCALDAPSLLHAYMAIGAGEEVWSRDYPWGWEQPAYNDSRWKIAQVIATSAVPAGYGSDNLWTLAPRTIPQMEEKMQRLFVVRRREGVKVDTAFLQGKTPLVIPAHTNASLLLDQSYETVAYPVLKVSGGKNATIKLIYAEALIDKNGQKGNRNEIDGKIIKGTYDIFHPDGNKDRVFTTLWCRTYRYLQIAVQTEDNPVTINDVYGIYTGYPFVHNATFGSNDSSLQQIWNAGWRTARLCAGETYFDCPYYEQLQYEGDTRIQSLISLYNTGDNRLMRKAINDFWNSRVPEGLTQGRYPSSRLQVIPPFSLFWVSMLYDYWMNCPDAAFVEKYLDAASNILSWYERHTDKNYQMLASMDWWNFTDWSFPGGVPPGATSGHSAVLTLQYVYTLRQAATLFNYFGRKETAKHYTWLANALARGTFQHCFDFRRRELADVPSKNMYSQHAGIMAILADAIPDSLQKQVMKNILYDTALTQCTLYYRFYLTRAMIKTGLGDLYYSQLLPWRKMLQQGLTTFAEQPDPTRSDCHAWSASPEYDFLATICGIMPSASGFREVRIAPSLGELTEVKGSMPLCGADGKPSGEISVALTRRGKTGVQGTVTLPDNLNGMFVWKGKGIELHAGKQYIDIQ